MIDFKKQIFFFNSFENLGLLKAHPGVLQDLQSEE